MWIALMVFYITFNCEFNISEEKGSSEFSLVNYDMLLNSSLN